MLMAAGLGTRMHPFTTKCPKAFLPLMGVPLVQYALDHAAAAGITQIVMNVHQYCPLDFPGILSDESEALLGSSGGMRKAIELLDDPFFIANADVLMPLPYEALKRAHGSNLVTLAVLPAYGNYTRVDVADGCVQGLGQGGYFYTGCALIAKEVIARLPLGPSDFVHDVLKPLIAQKRVGACILPQTYFFDCGTPQLWHASHAQFPLTQLPAITQQRFMQRHEPYTQGVIAKGARLQPCIYSDSQDEVGEQSVVYGCVPKGAPLASKIIVWGGLWASV